MFNASFQNAWRKRKSDRLSRGKPTFPRGSGQRQLELFAENEALKLPWAGIFEPWRPFVMVAAVTRGRERNARRRKRPLQLELLPDKGAQTLAPDPQRPLLDIFPEAYR